MNELIAYILKFGSLNSEQIKFVKENANLTNLQKDAYFSEAGKIPRQVGFVAEGVVRGCYYNNMGEEITRCFVPENNLLVDYVNFEAETPSSEYLQACTPCTVAGFSEHGWDELSQTLVGWDPIQNQAAQACMLQKSREDPVLAHTATTLSPELLNHHPFDGNRVLFAQTATDLG